MLMIEVLAILSASAAAGMRIALPLLVIGLLAKDQLWSRMPLLSAIDPRVVLAILVSWSLLELFGSKSLLGQRTLGWVELLFTPVVGALMAVTVVQIANLTAIPLWLVALIGGMLAFVLKLAQISWLLRLRRIPMGIVFVEDILCVLLVLFAFKAPQEGGLIAILLLWLAIRSASDWREYLQKKRSQVEREKQEAGK